MPTRVTPNALTWGMIVAGVAAAAALTVPGLWGAVAAVLLIQLQILLDCSDGELARWRDVRSTAGIYLDRIAHNLTEAALPIALAIRAMITDSRVMRGASLQVSGRDYMMAAREVYAGGAVAVTVVEMIGSGVVEVDSLLH